MQKRLRHPDEVQKAIRTQQSHVNHQLHDYAADHGCTKDAMVQKVVRNTALDEITVRKVIEKGRLPKSPKTLAIIAQGLGRNLSIRFSTKPTRFVTIRDCNNIANELGGAITGLRLSVQRQQGRDIKEYEEEIGLHCHTFETYFDAIIDLGFTPQIFLWY